MRRKVEFTKGSLLYPIQRSWDHFVCLGCDQIHLDEVLITLNATGIPGYQCKDCKSLYASKNDIEFALNIAHCGAEKE